MKLNEKGLVIKFRELANLENNKCTNLWNKTGRCSGCRKGQDGYCEVYHQLDKEGFFEVD